MTGLCKVQGVCEILEKLINSNIKFIVFAHHRQVIDKYDDYLFKMGIRFIRIDGAVTFEKRHHAAKEFQTMPHIRAALLSIAACSVGLTLTAASAVVFAENTWTPSIMMQAEDRAHRIGQKTNVNIYYCHGSGTIDDVMFQMIQEKQTVVAGALDSHSSDYQIKYGNQEQLTFDQEKDMEKRLAEERDM